ncbi:MAG: cytochrome c biogenesis protein CcsA [Methanosarcinales archaeon]|nr:cytochrome c biogenesis protein CcsA [Methanosarcinales archaeon]
MERGEIFLIFACILLLLDLILLLKVKGKAEEKKKLEIAFFASTIACVLVIAAYVRLTLAFLNDTFSLWEVYAYSSSSLSIWYKLGDPWIGSSGSMLFVTALFTTVYLVYRFKGFGKESVFHTTTYQILDVFLIFFLLVTLLKSPFELLPVIPPDGAGLNPLLQTFWVLVHPPVIFLGYVFVFFAFALTLAGMITGEQEELGRETLKLSLYAAWLFLALGIALGGWWSYEVLGWGGYWAWDPVETASLLPWLALTAYFHLPARSKDLAKELTLLITFFMIVFTAALTRGGLLESVHAFGESPVGPLLMVFAFSAVLYFFYLTRRANKPLYTFDVDTSSLFSISIFAAYWSLMFLLIICFFGDTAPIIGGFFTDTPLATNMDFYNKWCYPFTLIFVAALMGCNIGLEMKRYAGLITAVLITGVVLALLGQPTPNPLANFGLPLLIVAGFAIAYNFARLRSKKNSSSRLWGKTLVHLAIIVILIGVFVSSAAEEESGNIFATSDSTIEALGTTIELNNFTVYPGTGSVYFPRHNLILPEYSALEMDVVIKARGTVHHESLWMYYYTNYGVVSEPLIISTPREDLYVYMQHTNSSYNSLRFALMGEKIPPENVIIQVKRNPLIGFVWAGIVLLGHGMAILLLGELLRRDRKKNNRRNSD